VSDRAYRYRARANAPPGERRCIFCGSRSDIQVGHIDGDESHNESENLAWTCRSCNGRMAHVFKRAGIGRRTRQFNPGEGAKSLRQWLTAVTSMKGENSAMSVGDAIAMVHAAPDSVRSQFAAEIWRGRRERGTDSSEVPF
jgi:hypothetical protein